MVTPCRVKECGRRGATGVAAVFSSTCVTYGVLGTGRIGPRTYGPKMANCHKAGGTTVGWAERSEPTATRAVASGGHGARAPLPTLRILRIPQPRPGIGAEHRNAVHRHHDGEGDRQH